MQTVSRYYSNAFTGEIVYVVVVVFTFKLLFHRILSHVAYQADIYIRFT